MNLDKVKLVIRPRKGLEAIDLGFRLAQVNARALYQIWFAVSLPFFLLIVALLHDSPWWAAAVFWWLIPLFERPMLFFLSREIFAEQLSPSQCIKKFWPLAKIQWLASLTWRRFSLTRAVDLPVILLEQLAGETRSQRIRVIHAMDQSASFWLTFIVVLCQWILFFSVLALIVLFTPEIYQPQLDIREIWFGNWSAFGKILFFVTVYVVFSFFAPFYTSAGFTLYLNQRTLLESWDLELAFRRLAERLRRLQKNAAVRLASVVAAMMFISAVPFSAPVEAAEQKAEPVSFAAQVRAELDEILAGEEYHQKVSDYRYQLRLNEEPEQRQEISKVADFWSVFFRLLASVTEYALWLLVIAGLVYLLWRYGYLLMPGPGGSKKQKHKPPKTLFGLDLDSRNLPSDPQGVALNLINAGDYRAALSLLYRASLIWFIEFKKPDIRDGDTELQCLRKIEPVASREQGAFMCELTGAWRMLAYAHLRLPDDKLRALCKRWPFAENDAREQKS